MGVLRQLDGDTGVFDHAISPFALPSGAICFFHEIGVLGNLYGGA